MTVLLDVDGLGVTYRSNHENTPALVDVSLALQNGERLAVVGESGSGKSSLALAVAGLLPRSARSTGAITWPGHKSPIRSGRDIGFIFQDSGGTLDPVISVGRQLVEVVRANLDLDAREARHRSIVLLGQVRLPNPSSIFDAYPHQLSGGQKQRVGIAAAIAGEPALLIADEPTSALDTIVQAEIMALIDRIVEEKGMALLLVSHDIALAAQHSERMAVMYAGRIVELGATRDVVTAPRSDYARSLIRSASRLTARSGQAAS